jgi:regulator of cell morphogenesis and NO signaling
MDTQVFIDVTKIQPQLKHTTIFEAFDKAGPGASILIHNDHDPKPLYYQLLGLKGNCFSWTYLKKGPMEWEIEIKKDMEGQNKQTVGQIAAKDYRKAEVFKKFGLDFCCGGKKTLEDACLEKGIDILNVQDSLDHTSDRRDRQFDFNAWSLSFLCDYIVNTHHEYVRNTIPLLLELSSKVNQKHSKEHPELTEIDSRLTVLCSELITHMKKEESILFPYIKTLENFERPVQIGFNSVQDPIWVMESDHDLAGDLIHEINRLSGNYTVPESACNTYSLFLNKLREFEDDLMMHIHLENNILFPKAIAREKLKSGAN